MIPYTDSPEDLQKIVDVVVRGLASQGFQQSRQHSGRQFCRIRGEEGRKCALGWLLPDEEYNEIEMEELRRVYPHVLACAYEECPSPEYVDSATLRGGLVRRMQAAHDHPNITPDQMKRALREVVDFYRLRWPLDEGAA